MKHANILQEYGLFDAKVPRYTSYPPANRFEPNTGARLQSRWLAQVPKDATLSVYVHIPFCRRLCWFCACRTQGTKTMQPVAAYVDDLIAEINQVSRRLGGQRRMARLHLGGGTPTLLNVSQMAQVLDTLDLAFARTSDFEFSVEIDPTEAAPELLSFLADRGMDRASIGVQDFEPKVQAAIGRKQSFAQTQKVVDQLRGHGVTSLNIDLLYGLPYQDMATLEDTLRQVRTLQPDRLALYGYAHVPHMSKRQVMIPSTALPTPKERYVVALSARRILEKAGYSAIGIDHFALPSDSLFRAAKQGALRRNFQGYTDDPCETLIGFGASAISKFPQGFIQNAVATAAYQAGIRENRLAGHKGYEMDKRDIVISCVIDRVMCEGQVDPTELSAIYPSYSTDIHRIAGDLFQRFQKAMVRKGSKLVVRPGMEALARVMAAHVDEFLQSQHVHSGAI